MRPTALLLLFALAALLPAAPVPKPKPSALPEGWGQFLDPNRDCKVKIQKGKLAISLPRGHHDWQPPASGRQKWHAPRLLKEVRGDFTLTAKVAFERPDAAKVAYAGLVLQE